MPEITTVAVITGKPGTGEQVLGILSDLAVATQAEEGCRLYSLQRGTQNPDVFVTVEKWASAAALESHLASSHITTALGAAAELLAQPPLIVPAAPTGAGDPAKNAF